MNYCSKSVGGSNAHVMHMLPAGIQEEEARAEGVTKAFGCSVPPDL